MSDYYLFRKVQKRTLSRKNYLKVMTSSRIYKIFAILEILMASSSDDITNFSNFEFSIRLPLLFGATVTNQVSIIKNCKVVTIYILIFFRFQSIFRN